MNRGYIKLRNIFLVMKYRYFRGTNLNPGRNIYNFLMRRKGGSVVLTMANRRFWVGFPQKEGEKKSDKTRSRSTSFC